MFYEDRGPNVSEFNAGFYLVSISFQGFKPGSGGRLDSFPFSAHICHPRSGNLISQVRKVVDSVEWVYSSCLHAQHGRVLSISFSASQVADLRKPFGCLIIAKSYVGDYSYELSQACASAPERAAHTRNSTLSFLIVYPGTDHRPLSSCLMDVVYVKEFLRFFSWQHLENNVWNQKQICYFCAETSAFFKLACKQPFALEGPHPFLNPVINCQVSTEQSLYYFTT